MYSKNVTITNPTGLHARPASQFVQTAAKFESEIFLVNNGKQINAKSIMGVMPGGLSQGTELEIKATGADEQEAVETLYNLIESGFGE